MNAANRSFFALVATVLVPYVLLAAFGGGLLSVIVRRLATEGFAGLVRDDQDLRPGTVVFALVAGGTVAALVSVRRQVLATRRLAASLQERIVPAPAPLRAAARRCGLDGQVDVVDDGELFSFTYGLVRPRVAVSRGLVDGLDADQLDAVLAHERYHVRNRDPLKMVVARAASAAYSFLPALGHLRARYLAGRELAADMHATRATGTRPLVGALYRVLDQPRCSDLAAVGTAAALRGDGELLDLRIAQLESGEETRLRRVPALAVAVTAAGLTALSASFLLTVVRTGEVGGSGGGGVLAVLGPVACWTAWAWLALTALGSAAGDLD